MRGALPLAQAEPDTTAWFAIQVDSSTFGIVGISPMPRTSHPAIVNFLDMIRVTAGWRLEEVEVRPVARLDGTTVGRIRAAHPDVRILAVTQRGAGYVAFAAHEVTLGPGDLVLLLSRPPGSSASCLRAVGYGQTCRNEP